MPDVLDTHDWDCPEPAELNRWTTEFLARKERFAMVDAKIATSLENILNSLSAIRHTAVHRLRISAKILEQYLVDAESFLALLGDQAKLVVIERLLRETQGVIWELERNKQVLNLKRERTQERITIQRAELDRLERALVADMVKEDSDYQALAGINLEQAILMVDTSSKCVRGDYGIDADADDTDSIDEHRRF